MNGEFDKGPVPPDPLGYTTVGISLIFTIYLNSTEYSDTTLYEVLRSTRVRVVYRRWWRSIVVRTSILAGELSLSCARLMDGRVTLVGKPSAISQPTRPTQPAIPPWSVK